MRRIQSVQRALNIINCFNEIEYRLTLKEISEKLDLNINTSRGLVNTLLYNGYLKHHEEDNTYSLGFVFLTKAQILEKNFEEALKNHVDPFLKRTSEKYDVSARLQIIENYNVFTISSFVPKNSRYIVSLRPNTLFPHHATASGKLYLYFLEEKEREKLFDSYPLEPLTENTITEPKALKEEFNFIKENGFSKEYDEAGIGISSLACPIFLGNELIGTISISSSTENLLKIQKKAIHEIKEFIKNIDL